jgi:ComF family protein
MFLNTILDIVFPAKCISCGKSGTDLCAVCLNDAPAAERETAEWVFPIYDYRHPLIKKSLWLLKYSGKKRLAKIFAENIYGKMMEELSELSLLENFHNIILIPIPLSKKRYRERGFNQAQLICEEIIKISRRGAGGEVFTLEKNILIKTRETEHQARIKDRSVRLKNLAGTFAVKNSLKDNQQNEKFLKGKNIILIDDITTTGATLNEARRTLKKSGARKVIAFTVAH